MRRPSRCLALVAAFGLFAPFSAESATFCVGDGPSLQTALTQAASNGEDDQIRLRAGTYTMGSGTTAFTFASSEAHRLEVSGGWQNLGLVACAFAFADPSLSVLDGANQRRVLDISTSSTNSNAMIEVRNLTIRGGSGNSFGGMRVSGGDNVRLDRLIVRNNHATNSESPGGVLVTAVRGMEIANSLILDNTCANGPCGAKLVTAQPVASVSVLNNTVARNRCPAIACPMSGIFLDNFFSTLVANNAFHENEGAQLELAPANANAVELRNNRIDALIGTPTHSSGNIVAPIPGFVDAAGGNFRLRQDSPLLDAGDAAISAGESDLDGNARTNGRERDIGAYELPYALFADGFESDDD